MTSATTKPASGAGGRHAQGHGSGLVTFASILLALAGTFNLMHGLCAYGSRDNAAAFLAGPGSGAGALGREANAIDHPGLDFAGGRHATV